MSDEVKEVKETDTNAECVVVDLEERRAERNLKHWLVKGFAITLMVVFVASTLTLIYAAVIQEKDLNTGFIGEIFKGLFDFLRFILA